MMFYILLLLIIVACAYLVYRVFTLAKQKKQSLSLVFFKVLIPKKESDLDEKKDSGSQHGGFKEVVAVMEQLLASLHEIGKDKAISLEYVSQKGAVHFYMGVPFDLYDVVEKQVTSYYPDAIIEQTEEPNIFAKESFQEATALVLKKKEIWPLRTYQQLESDPINNIVNSLSKLKDDDSAMIQIMLRPVKNDWQKKSKKLAETLYSGKKPTELSLMTILKDVVKILTPDSDDKKDEPARITPQTEELVKAIDGKAQKVGFDAVIRVVASSSDAHQAKSAMDALVNSFVQFGHPNMNSFTKAKKRKTKEALFDLILRRFDHVWPANPMTLSTEELASFFHFPHSKYNKLNAIKWQNFKLAPPPDNLSKDGILLGHATIEVK